MVRTQAAECSARVGDGDGVRGQVRAHVALLHGVELDVEVQDIDTHETEADAETQAHEGSVAERFDIVDMPSLERWFFARSDPGNSHC